MDRNGILCKQSSYLYVVRGNFADDGEVVSWKSFDSSDLIENPFCSKTGYKTVERVWD